MTQGLRCTLTPISAPAGSGKTTRVSEWQATADGRRPALLVPGRRDNDVARFLSYLIAAVAAARPGFGRAALALVRSPQPVAAQTVLAYLLQEVSAFEQTLVLALDDYHVITAQPIYDGLAYLLDHLPEQLRLVIVTRADRPCRSLGSEPAIS